MIIPAYLAFVFALMVTCQSTVPPSVSTTDKSQANLIELLKNHFEYYCDYICKHHACPPDCADSYIGPWARRSASKRAFDQSSEFNGLTFDDYGLFMKLLGRDVDKRKR